MILRGAMELRSKRHLFFVFEVFPERELHRHLCGPYSGAGTVSGWATFLGRGECPSAPAAEPTLCHVLIEFAAATPHHGPIVF
jgi:hypothetical protein